MTKKSAGRLLRDEEKKKDSELFKKNSCWSDLADLQNPCLDLIISTSRLAQELLDTTLIPFYENYKSVTVNMSILARDLNRISSTYQGIVNKHVNRSGSASPEEFMDCMKISAEYAALKEDIDGTMMPTVLHLIEEFGMAKQRQFQASTVPALTPEQDPSVITDVEVKEISA